jgi:hypothetical protein
VALIVLGLDFAGIPYAYARYAAMCTQRAQLCNDSGLLTPEGLQMLQEFGLSRGFYAAYVGVGIQTVVTLVYIVIAAVIFARRSDDGMALFTSFTLLIFGGAAVAGTMYYLAEAHHAFWFPVNLLNYAGQVSFGIFLYLFPDGRFVPRWTRWLAAASLLLFVPEVFFPDSPVTTVTGPLFWGFLGTLIFAQVGDALDVVQVGPNKPSRGALRDRLRVFFQRCRYPDRRGIAYPPPVACLRQTHRPVTLSSGGLPGS